MYLLTTLVCVTYLYLMDRKFDKLAFLFILFPISIVYFQVPAFQYNVGTDYMSYVDMYKYGYNIEYYFNKKEWVFYLVLKIATEFQLGEQAIFILVSVFYSFFWIFLIFLLKNENYKVWLFVLLYFTVTGIYQNQLNGLRQYMAIAILPCIFVLFYKKRYLATISLTLLATLCHASFLILYPFFFVFVFKPSPRLIIYFFTISFVFSAVIIPKLLPVVVNAIFGGYSGYFESELSVSANAVSLITKAFYFPLFVLAIFQYKKDVKENVYNKEKYEMLMYFFMILSLTYWLFIVNMYFGFFGRVAQYFMIFYIFPIYYLLERYLEQRKIYMTLLLFVYVITPYLLKVTLFAKSEYDYQSIIGFM